MPNYNPRFPDTLGPELLLTHNQVSPVHWGSPQRWMRYQSTLTETIASLRLPIQVNPTVRDSVPTLIDICVAGNEQPDPFQLLHLAPSADVVVGGWRTDTGASTNLFQAIDEDPTQWSANAPAAPTWIENTTPFDNYECNVNASDFASGGPFANARIGWVAIQAILGMNTHNGNLRVNIEIGGVNYEPAGGNLKGVHGYGEIVEFWYGEINPATGRPWTPADIALFASSSTIKIRSQEATASKHPRVYALALNVQCLPVENRVAVAGWRRPENIGTSRLLIATTDFLRRLPQGTADWPKAAATTYLVGWRQTISPSQYGSVVADDVAWSGAFQDLGPSGKPPGIVYPFESQGVTPSATGLASDRSSHDPFGRPDEPFAARSRAVYAVGFVRSDAAFSADSHPYRLDITDLEEVTSTQKVGQRVTPSTSQTYIGVRFPIVPPASGNPTLTVAVHRISDGVQIGGSYQLTANFLKFVSQAAPGGIRYAAGFFSSPVSLVGGTAYEIRITTTSGGTWLVPMPDCSVANTASFGGSTNGAFIGATHQPSRDLMVNLIKQPSPPAIAAAVTEHPVSKVTVCGIESVQHVTVTGTPVSIGGSLLRMELERELDASGDWVPIHYEMVNDPFVYVDRVVPRGSGAKYRLRTVATDGRISAWAETPIVTPQATGAEMILTSDARPDLELVFDYDPESTYPILSNERREIVPLEGVPLQVVFKERFTRGVGWSTSITLNGGSSCPPELRGGVREFQPLLDLIDADDIPYVVVLDYQGSRWLGSVEMSEPKQEQPLDRYTAQIDIIPTNLVEFPTENP